MTDLDRDVARAMGWTDFDTHPGFGCPPVGPTVPDGTRLRVPSVTDPAWLTGALLWCAEKGLDPLLDYSDWHEPGVKMWEALLFPNNPDGPSIVGRDNNPGAATALAIVSWKANA